MTLTLHTDKPVAAQTFKLIAGNMARKGWKFAVVSVTAQEMVVEPKLWDATMVAALAMHARELLAFTNGYVQGDRKVILWPEKK